MKLVRKKKMMKKQNTSNPSTRIDDRQIFEEILGNPYNNHMKMRTNIKESKMSYRKIEIKHIQ